MAAGRAPLPLPLPQRSLRSISLTLALRCSQWCAPSCGARCAPTTHSGVACTRIDSATTPLLAPKPAKPIAADSVSTLVTCGRSAGEHSTSRCCWPSEAEPTFSTGSSSDETAFSTMSNHARSWWRGNSGNSWQVTT